MELRIRQASTRVIFCNEQKGYGGVKLVVCPVPVQREMERGRSPLMSIPPLRGGDFQGIRVYRSDMVLGRARKANFRARSSSTVGDASWPQLIDSKQGDACQREILVSRLIYK